MRTGVWHLVESRMGFSNPRLGSTFFSLIFSVSVKNVGQTTATNTHNTGLFNTNNLHRFVVNSSPAVIELTENVKVSLMTR